MSAESPFIEQTNALVGNQGLMNRRCHRPSALNMALADCWIRTRVTEEEWLSWITTPATLGMSFLVSLPHHTVPLSDRLRERIEGAY